MTVIIAKEFLQESFFMNISPSHLLINYANRVIINDWTFSCPWAIKERRTERERVVFAANSQQNGHLSGIEISKACSSSSEPSTAIKNERLSTAFTIVLVTDNNLFIAHFQMSRRVYGTAL
jgi:hypothetical protein